MTKKRMEPATAWFCIKAIQDMLQRRGEGKAAKDLEAAVLTLMEEVANDVASPTKARSLGRGDGNYTGRGTKGVRVEGRGVLAARR
jgi:hypothetical protein